MRSNLGRLAALLGGLSGCAERAERPSAADAQVSAPTPSAAPALEVPDAAPPAKADRLVVLVGGDVNLGRGAGQQDRKSVV